MKRLLFVALALLGLTACEARQPEIGRLRLRTETIKVDVDFVMTESGLMALVFPPDGVTPVGKGEILKWDADTLAAIVKAKEAAAAK